jgi:hypothetical protein
MTNELEKTFFDTFGIEPKWKSEQCDGWLRTTAVAYFTNLEEAKKFGIVFQEEPEYPQITDRILLELICIATASEITIEFRNIKNIEHLKSVVLAYCKERYSYHLHKDNFKHQVRTLFEEG